MKTVSNRQLRRTVTEQQHQVERLGDSALQAIQTVAQNEMRTRQRVDALEAFRDMTFTQRLRWLLRGYA